MSKLQDALSSVKSNNEVDLDAARVDLEGEDGARDCISTGSIVVDHLIGGNKLKNGEKQCPGIPRGRICEIFGPQGSGKTTMALETAVQCQQDGGEVGYIDYENAIDLAYAKSLGLDVEDETFELISPRHFEEGGEIIASMVEAGVDLIVVDSVAAMRTKDQVEGNPSDEGQIGHLARKMAAYLPNIVDDLRKANSALMLVNQLRSRIKTGPYDSGPDEETTGGKAIKYYCSLRMKLKKTKREYAKTKDELRDEMIKQQVSTVVRARNVKNKVSPHQGHTSEFVIRYGEGVDNLRSVVDIAASRGVINQAGAWYNFEKKNGEVEKCHGREEARNFFEEHPEEFKHLVQRLRGQLTNDIESVDTENKEMVVEEAE